jgi:amino acid adenylation domain-containing protein/non-ribosomal peptide synthase protein (TIGR01720 family)
MPEHSPNEFRLTAAQDGVWFAQKLDPRSPRYNIAECLGIHGALDAELLVSAIARAIGETDAVRAEFFEVDGAPFQRVADRAYLPRLLDLSGEPDPAAAAEEFMARDLATAFDLSTPVRESIPGRADEREFAHEPLFRFVVIRLAPELHYWYSCYHHLVIDGMGGAVFSRRVAQVYAAALVGAEPEPAAAGPLSRLIEDEDAYRGSKEYERDRVYWAERFADGPGEAVLPVARRAGSAASTGAGGCPERDHGALVAPEVLDGMRTLAGANATTWPVTFVAAVALYVARAAGSPDVTLGLATNGRRNAVRGVVGMTANIVPLRLRVEPETTISALIKAVGAEMRGALQHRRYSREQLVRDVKAAGPAGRLGAIVVNILHYDYDLELGQAPTTSRMLSAGPVEDISVYIRDRGEDSEPKIGLEANPELYLPQDLLPHRHGITGALAALATADPQSSVAALDFLDAEDRAALLETGRGAQASTATESLAALFDRSVEATGVAAVAVCGDGGELTYGELDERARALAGVLAGAGVGPADAVGVLLERSAAVVVSTLGIVRAGAAYVPFDARWPVERVRAAASIAGIKAVVTDGALRNHPWLAALEAEIPVFELDSSGALTGEDLKTAEPETLPYGGERLAYAMFTSGSTGEPKAVGISHADVAALAFDHAWDDGIGEAVLMHSPHAFDASTFEIWTPLLHGGRIIIPPAGALEADTLRDLVTRYEVAAVFMTTALFNALAEQDPTVFSGLRMLCAGGEAATPDLMQRIAATCPNTTICHVYGPTETTTFTTLHRVRPDTNPVPPIGRALDGMRLYVLDSALKLVPHGATGELYIAGHGLARGYLNRSDLTASRFVPDLFANDGSRMYRTGDLVRWTTDTHSDSGAIEYIGRVDRQIKLRGFRIELGEIENVLLTQPEINAACVLLREDRPGDKRLVAYLAVNTDVDLGALRTTLGAALPPYMIPAAFVTLPSLPLTPNGKIDRRALPVPDITSGDSPRRAPSNPREEILCTLFADVLGLAEIGVDENFFDLGGHSLLATRLASRIRTTLNTDITVRTIFDHPTVLELVAATENARPGRTRLVPVERPETVPLSPAQQRLWFLNRLDGPSATYNVPIVLRLAGELNIDALDAALHDLIERHETLRTTFPEYDGQPQQLILPAGNTGFALQVLDAAEPEIRELTDRITTEPFDVLSDTPIRATLLHAAEDDHTLILVIHHIAADGWSLAPLARDLETAYWSRTQGQAPDWQPLPVQYADFTLWQDAGLGASDDAGSIAAAQLAHWREHLADLPELLDLPYDHPRPAVPTYQGDAVTFRLEPALHDALEHLARQTGTSLFMVLQAAVAILLSKHGAGTDIPLGTPIAGRTDQALDQLVGFFVNSLVLRTDLSGDPSVRELLTRIRMYDLQAYEHQELPFEQLVEHLNPSRAGSHHPLFQTMLVLQNQDPGAFTLPGLTVQTEPPRTGISKFDLTFGFTPERGEQGARLLSGELEYSTELFTPETAAALVSRLIDLLAEIAARPDARVSALEVTSAQERAELLACGRGARAVVPEASLSDLFDRRVQALGAGAGTVAVCGDGGELTYGELDERSRVLAGVLAGAGVGSADAVGVLLERSAAVVVSTLGIVRAGAAYVPFDARWPVERIRAAAHTAGVKAVVTDGASRRHPWLVTLDAEIPVYELDSSGVVIGEDLKTAEPETLPYGGEHLAYAMFTSGSTGEPKAVAITHADVAALAFAHEWDDGVGQAVLMHSPYAFDASTFELWTPLLRGGRIIIPPAGALELETLREVVARYEVTAMFLTAALFASMAEQDPTVFTGLRIVCAGGEAATPGAMEAVAAACPDTAVCNVYGPTETTTFTTLHRVRPDAGSDAVPPIGRALDGMRLYVLDSDLNLVPHGGTGELYIAGHGLARGYLNRPDLTAARFVPDPFTNDGSRMYRTGDLARWTENDDVAYIGRVDRQIKLRGFRIELSEIENALASRPEINAACVLLREDRPGDKRLVAYVAANTRLNLPALRTTLAETLPLYMIPAAFVTLPQLPLTPNGKIDRKALPAPDIASGSDTPRRAPSNAREEILCTLFADVLGLPEVGVDENFFDLGGHSLLATRLASRIRTTLQAEITVRTIFDHPTIHDLAAAIETARPGRKPLLAAERPEVVPLSPAQQRLWFIDRLDGPSATYNVPIVLGLHGDLDVSALEAALRDLIARHETLRTTFPEHDGQPQQLILSPENTGFALHVIEADESQIQELIDRIAAEPFDVLSETPIRATLLHTAEDDHTLILVIHHIAADGWSLAPLAHDLETAYGARRSGQAPDWTPLPVQYADFTLWQHALLGASDDNTSIAATQLAHWREHLADLPELLDLPYDHVRPTAPTHQGDAVTFQLEPAMHEALQHVARETDTSLFMVLQAAVAILLSKHGAGTDIPLGTPIAGRTDQALDQLVGFFVNSLVLRTDLSGDPSVRELLTRIRTYDLQAYEHQELPFEQLVEHLNPSRAGNHHPLFQTMLVLQNQQSEVFALPGLTVETAPPRTSVSKFDLTFAFTPERGALGGGLEYSTELFTRETAAALVSRLIDLLAEIAARPDARVSALEVTSADERARLLACGRGARAVVPEDSLSLLFDRSVEAAGVGAVAVCADDGVELTYGELDGHARVLAGVLAGAGVGPEDAVGVLLERSAAVVVSTVGIVRAGAAYVPFDARWPVERIRAAAHTVGIKAVVTDGSLRSHPWLAALEIPVFELDSSGVLVDEDLKTAEPETLPSGGEHLAYAMFTSGSTGEPKAVAITHADVAALAFDHAWDDGIGETVLMHSPHAFDASTYELWTPLLRGGRIIIPPSGGLEADTLRDVIKTHTVSAMFMTTALFNTLAEQDPTVFSGLRMLSAGGEAATPDLMQRIATACPDTTVCHVYGPTETTTFTTLHVVRSDTEAMPPIGRALDGMRLYVLDSDLNLVPHGATGELYIAGHGLARGYLNRPDLTAGRFVPDPFTNDGSRMYRTGDLARWTENDDVAYIGRVDRQIKLRGFRIELSEIENVLLAQPEINAACVLLREDRPGDKRLVAYVATNNQINVPALRTTLAETLPPYMIPAAFVTLPQLPLTPNGKIDRKALPAPDVAATSSDTPRRAPSNPREEILCTLFADTLGVPHIGIDDNFFDLGGHSLLATRLASRIRSTLNTDITIRTIFDHPTIHELAHILDEHTSLRHVALQPTPRPTNIPLSPAQRRLWFLNRLEGPNATYNVPMILHLRGPLDDTALDAALRDLIERHESLRTVFPEADGHPRQLILDADATGFTLRVVNTTPTDVERLTTEATAEPFDVQIDLPIRATLFHTDATGHVLVLVIHHIAADGWSMAPLTRDLETAYCSRIEATAPDWEPLPVQYADFTLWQHAGLGASDDADSIAATQLTHWREHLANLPELLDLPYDHPRPAIPTHRGDAVAFHVEPALHDALNHLARQTDTSLFMVLQAAVAILLSKHGAGTDIPLGTPIAGRTDQALDQLIGFFVNSLVLRTDLAGDPTVHELLTRIRTYDLEAYGHQELPFEQLVEHLNPSRTGSHHPLFQTMLVLQNQDSGTFALPGLTVETEPPRTGISKFDLTFGFTPTPTPDGTRSLHGALEYSTELFTEHTAETLAARLVHLLAEVAANPDARVSALEISSAQECAELLTMGRGARAADPQAETESLAALFDRSAQAAGAGAIAVCAADGVELTYGELDERARVLAGVLAGIGITPEDAVGVLLERSAAVVVSTLGIVRAGGVYVPFDARWPVDRIRAAARTAGVKAVVTDGVLRTHPWLVGLEADIPVLELDASGVLISEGLKRIEPETLPYGGERLAYAMFTSGSTGEPKAVAITHADVATLALDHAWDNGNDQAVLMHSPHAFDASTFELWTPLLRGGRIIIPPPGTLETDTLRDLVARHKVTGTFITAALFATIAAQDPTVFAGMRSICAGGDAATPGAMESVAAACPNTTVLNAYGPTETTTFAALHRVQATNTDQTQPPPIGRPLDGMRLYILDNNLTLVPHGATGELYIAGHGLARGYLNRPDLTASRFVPDPFANDGSRMYRTGDLARWTDDNHVACLGRIDHQIKLRGFRIELGEIENALLTQPEIDAACVLLREDRPGVRQLVAYTVGVAQQDTDALRTALAQLVPEYMMPSAFVALDALPLTPNGKVDRKALPAPSVPERATNTATRLPLGEAEEVVCGVFADVLGLPGVDLDDDFFRLGGDSILSIQVVSRVRREGLVITPRDVFTHRTPEAIAAVAVPLGEEPAAERGTGVGEIPPTPIVSWLLETPGPLDGHNQTMVFQVPADADESRLAAVLQALVDHHDVLRLQLVEQEGAPPVLETLPSGAVAAGQLLSRVDVAELDAAAVSAATREQAEAARRRLSPRTGTMLQALWFDVGAGQSGRLMLVIHHLAVDGVSWRVLAADLAAAWEGLGDADEVLQHSAEVDAEHGGLRSDVRRAARRLEPVGTTFKRWAELLVAEAHSAEREEELPLWQGILDTPDPLLGARPLDPAEDTAATVRTLTLELAPEWTEPLLGEVPAAWNADVNDVLLTGLALAVNARRIETGQQAVGGVLIDLEGHGREQIVDGVDLSRTVGWFTSLFPVSLDPGPIAAHEARDLGGPLLERALKQVKEQLRQIPDHGIGYGLLRYLNPHTRAVLEGAPTPQIGFNYLGRFSVEAKEAGTPEADWRIVPESDIPRSQDPDMPAAHAIEVNAHTRVLGAGPTLVSTWTWPAGLLDETEARALAEAWLRVLRALVEHVRNADAAGGYTPSDLPLVSISQSQLDKLQMKWSGRK